MSPCFRAMFVNCDKKYVQELLWSTNRLQDFLCRSTIKKQYPPSLDCMPASVFLGCWTNEKNHLHNTFTARIFYYIQFGVNSIFRTAAVNFFQNYAIHSSIEFCLQSNLPWDNNSTRLRNESQKVFKMIHCYFYLQNQPDYIIYKINLSYYIHNL